MGLSIYVICLHLHATQRPVYLSSRVCFDAFAYVIASESIAGPLKSELPAVANKTTRSNSACRHPDGILTIHGHSKSEQQSELESQGDEKTPPHAK